MIAKERGRGVRGALVALALVGAVGPVGPARAQGFLRKNRWRRFRGLGRGNC